MTDNRTNEKAPGGVGAPTEGMNPNPIHRGTGAIMPMMPDDDTERQQPDHVPCERAGCADPSNYSPLLGHACEARPSDAMREWGISIAFEHEVGEWRVMPPTGLDVQTSAGIRALAATLVDAADRTDALNGMSDRDKRAASWPKCAGCGLYPRGVAALAEWSTVVGRRGASHYCGACRHWAERRAVDLVAELCEYSKRFDNPRFARIAEVLTEGVAE